MSIKEEILHYCHEAKSNQTVAVEFKDKAKAEYWRGRADALQVVLDLIEKENEAN